MKILLVFVLVITYSFCLAQTDSIPVAEKKANEKIAQLRRERVKTILCYYVDCVGYMHGFNPDSCTSFQPEYLFWTNNNLSFIQRFDECTDYKPMNIRPALYNLIKSNYKQIQKAKIEYPVYYGIVDGKQVKLTTMVDHSCHNIFEFYTNDKELKKDIDDFALETQYIDKKYVNLNYQSNKKSILIKLKGIVEREVAVYDKNLKTERHP
ncbi:MAG: hypothetical protein ABI113_20170 [Mucilaginibacter sp.]